MVNTVVARFGDLGSVFQTLTTPLFQIIQISGGKSHGHGLPIYRVWIYGSCGFSPRVGSNCHWDYINNPNFLVFKIQQLSLGWKRESHRIMDTMRFALL